MDSKFNNTYFIADTHFGDERIIKYENRDFRNVQEMDKAIINNWNSVVTENDRIFMLGDFSVYDRETNEKIIKQLNGYKILVMGNHDMNFTDKDWESMGFDKAIDCQIIFNNFFMISHEPMYINMNMPYANIFGHVHGSPLYNTYSPKSFCVSVERINYTPILFEKIFETIKKQPNTFANNETLYE